MTEPLQPLRRLPDWPERLALYLAQHADTPFHWGAHDCVHFAAGAVRAMCGADVLPTHWHDRTQAAQVLRAMGGLEAAVDVALPRLAGTQWAQRGDVLMVRTPTLAGCARRWLAVADGPRWWAPTRTGLASGSTAQAVAAWGVGHA